MGALLFRVEVPLSSATSGQIRPADRLLPDHGKIGLVIETSIPIQPLNLPDSRPFCQDFALFSIRFERVKGQSETTGDSLDIWGGQDMVRAGDENPERGLLSTM